MTIDPMHRPFAPTRIAFAAALLALLAACGGGGDSMPGAVAVSPAAATSSPVASTADAGAAGTCGLPDFAAAVLARVNRFRAAGASCGSHGAFAPAPDLAWNLALTQAADSHSRDMVANNHFSHTGANGSNAGQRITAAGYDWQTYGENIAAGQTAIDAVVDGWMASEGHCANLMNAEFLDIGVACEAGSSATVYRTYWSMELGRTR